MWCSRERIATICSCFATNGTERLVQELKLTNPVEAQEIKACIAREVAGTIELNPLERYGTVKLPENIDDPEYADDIVLVLKEKAQVFLNELTKAIPFFAIHFALTRCMAILLGMQSRHRPLTIQGETLEVVEHFTYLGDRFRQDLQPPRPTDPLSVTVYGPLVPPHPKNICERTVQDDSFRQYDQRPSGKSKRLAEKTVHHSRKLKHAMGVSRHAGWLVREYEMHRVACMMDENLVRWTCTSYRKGRPVTLHHGRPVAVTAGVRRIAYHITSTVVMVNLAHSALTLFRLFRNSYSASSRTHVTSQCRLLSAVIDGPQQMWAKWLSIERETGCLYIKGAMHSPTREKAIKNKTNSSLPNHTDQCKCSSLDSLLLGVVYRSPSSPPEDDHFLIRTLGQLSSSYHFTHLLLVGDFNAPKAPWTELQCVGSSGPFAAALTEVVQQSAWTQHVVAPTRYRAGQQPSLLDLVITNERHFVDQVTINAPLGHSDHCVLTFDFICYWARNPEPQTWIRNFCRADFSGMRIFLNQVKLGPASVEDLYRTIVQKVHEADAMYVPKKPARSRTSRKLPKRIRRLLEKRSQLFLKKLTTGDTEDELAFRKMRNRCKSEIRQWNIRKQATILDLARKNRNVLFKYMRHRRRNKPSAFSLRDRNGEPTSDPIVVSEFYRDHYAGDSANSFVMHGEKGPEDITRIDAKKDLGIWLSPNLSFSLHLEKLAQKAFAVLRMIRRTFSRITRTDFQILYGAYVRPLLEYANPVVYSGRTKDVILIERVQRAATKMVAGLKSMDYETRLVVLDLFPLEYLRLRGDLILTYALFEQGLTNRFFTVDPANTRRGHAFKYSNNDQSVFHTQGPPVILTFGICMPRYSYDQLQLLGRVCQSCRGFISLGSDEGHPSEISPCGSDRRMRIGIDQLSSALVILQRVLQADSIAHNNINKFPLNCSNCCRVSAKNCRILPSYQ
ncbi:hypothetical protein CLF_109069 [Clonorchis sinensis]|uniref:Endonuclease/exonuclease/phosphatase domain-containing protein n=1 Tax=Clonorchis sinensis TaxID=79923 RepID=G7YIX0_CLOSI|nr:hypothetical protein CLF_109069 [Clonorchis sinensis]